MWTEASISPACKGAECRLVFAPRDCMGRIFLSGFPRLVSCDKSSADLRLFIYSFLCYDRQACILKPGGYRWLAGN